MPAILSRLSVLFINYGPYYKSKLELKSNLSETLPVNCKFICVYIFFFASSQTLGPKFEFCQFQGALNPKVKYKQRKNLALETFWFYFLTCFVKKL